MSSTIGYLKCHLSPSKLCLVCTGCAGVQGVSRTYVNHVLSLRVIYSVTIRVSIRVSIYNLYITSGGT